MQLLRCGTSPRVLSGSIAAKRRQIKLLLASRSFRSVYQPICRTADGSVAGYECLTRFLVDPPRPPDVWFGDAAEVGLGPALELQTIKAALRQSGTLSEVGFLGLNVSPDMLLSGYLAPLLKVVDPARVVLELTEHAQVADYVELHRMLDGLRARGARLAVDDVGAGYASLQHILSLRPDIIKVDISLVRDIDRCPAREALMAGLVSYARMVGCSVVAEGVEERGEFEKLRSLGVEMAQGFWLGRPEPADLLVAAYPT